MQPSEVIGIIDQSMESNRSTVSRTCDKVTSPAPSSGVAGTLDYCVQCPVRHRAICSVLEDRELAALAAITRHRAVSPGSTIFEEGDPADHLFNVSAGTVRIYKMLPDGRRQITGFLFPGDFLGLAGRENYAYGAEAVTAAQLCRFGKKDFQDLTARYPQLCARLFDRANDDLSTAQEQMLLLGRKSPQEKLASFLLRIWHTAKRWDRPGTTITLDMNREDIADYLGLTVETISRTFTRLKTRGIIALPSRNRVEIRDPDALADMAEEAGL